ncbi:hypothetical protein H6781_00545 [Candidatus Nomurabacteria bacterium]|nr:hypothetical protein [Candidatus Kaiserbacteria bacterium]MCB9810071.1 hypothetical protein [Candidatus Nomurabacteria bacterium]
MPDLTQLSDSSLSFNTIIRLALYLVLGVYAIFSAIFYYHWSSYGTDAKITTYTLILYFATTIPLLIVMTILALII